jgi:small subunit ribosomal protein S17
MATEKKAKKPAKEKAAERSVEPKIAPAVVAVKEGSCGDRNCPTHGTLSTRGMSFEGVVVSDKMRGTVLVLCERMIKDKKYERYLKSRSKIAAHNPPCIKAKAGVKVRIMECRRLSKTVSFVVVSKNG